jgi:EAL domain.
VLSRIEINGELMRADQFIEIAEKMSMIHRLDAIVIEGALRQVAEKWLRWARLLQSLAARACAVGVHPDP